MRIRNKILIYFSSTVVVLLAISLTIIYILFSEYREEEFQQQQFEKIKYTIGLIAEFKEMSEELAYLLDAQDIHDFYDEKLLVFNNEKELVFSSLDSLEVLSTENMLNNLSISNDWIETKEDDYDVIGVYVINRGVPYYAVSKAYDASGYSKMYFLSNILIAIFIVISVIVILVSIYLSNKISRPITTLAENLSRYDLTSEDAATLKPDISSHELEYLTRRFNDLLKRTKEAFAFQKNAIQHISHELKTPVTVLVSELERLKNFENIDDLKLVLDGQINKAKSLGEIVNVLLEISKVESGQPLVKTKMRMDEVLFDLIGELKSIYPDFNFELNYYPSEFEESALTIEANKMLIKQAFQNLLINSINYCSEEKAQIKLDCSVEDELIISISNFGETLSSKEEKSLFNHSFRGKNSKNTMGFGLGLVLAKKIILFHSGEIIYSNPSPYLNVFKVKFPFK